MNSNCLTRAIKRAEILACGLNDSRLDGKIGRQKELRRRAKRAMRGDLESKIQGMYGVVEGNLAMGKSRLAYGAIRKLRSF